MGNISVLKRKKKIIDRIILYGLTREMMKQIYFEEAKVKKKVFEDLSGLQKGKYMLFKDEMDRIKKGGA